MQMSDYISRQAAFEALEKRGVSTTNISRVPIADVRENVRGEWVIVVDKTEMCDKEGVKTWGSLCQCNKCGFVLNAVEGHIGQYNFCPNCGADMRGES